VVSPALKRCGVSGATGYEPKTRPGVGDAIEEEHFADVDRCAALAGAARPRFEFRQPLQLGVVRK
jgi:hypothetical protein